MRETGVVDWFDRSYGFITRDNGDHLFVHYSEIEIDGYRLLETGQLVEYEIGAGPNGRLCARHVKVAN